MRIQRLAVTLAAGVALTACGATSSGTAAGAPATTAAAPSRTASAPATSAPATNLPVTDAPVTSAPVTNAPVTSGATPASAGTACHSSDLLLQVIMGPQDAPSPSGGKGDFYIQLINTSTHTCTLYGYPGVELLDQSTGRPLGMKDVRNAASSGSGKPVQQTLAPRSSNSPQTASAAYVQFDTKAPGASAGYPRAVKVQVIPPNETQPLVADIDNLYAKSPADDAIMVSSTTLSVGPMGGDGVPMPCPACQ
ncbi:hypothetical protein ABH930_001965 [Kitasatospora sp. GAS204A]|nr:hypothetical protein [Kitasatospora sp. GAS204B]